MGLIGLQGMLETASESGFSRRSILEWHIVYNHYPSLPFSVVDIAEKAIDLAIDNGYDEIIKFSEFDSRFGDKQMVVRDVIDNFHLWQFLADDCDN